MQLANMNMMSNVHTKIEKLADFKGTDLDDLCEAIEASIIDEAGFSIGFHASNLPERNFLENYFKGILLVPDRTLIVARYDGAIAGFIQLLKPHFINESASFAISLENHFVAPWARGYGLARKLLLAAEQHAYEGGFKILKLSIRSSLTPALSLYQNQGYKIWGTLDKYEMINNKMIEGHFLYKELL